MLKKIDSTYLQYLFHINTSCDSSFDFCNNCKLCKSKTCWVYRLLFLSILALVYLYNKRWLAFVACILFAIIFIHPTCILNMVLQVKDNCSISFVILAFLLIQLIHIQLHLLTITLLKPCYQDQTINTSQNFGYHHWQCTQHINTYHIWSSTNHCHS